MSRLHLKKRQRKRAEEDQRVHSTRLTGGGLGRVFVCFGMVLMIGEAGQITAENGAGELTHDDASAAGKTRDHCVRGYNDLE
jgi:hypothetical protein